MLKKRHRKKYWPWLPVRTYKEVSGMEAVLKNFKSNERLKRFIGTYGTEISTLMALLIMCIILSNLSDSFLKVGNLLTVLLQSSINSVIAVGMTFIIISGGIDLSVGSIVALSTAVMGEMVVNRGMNPFVGLVLALLIGLFVGMLQGSIIAYVKIPPFIVTLGGMTIWRGVALEFVNGQNLYGLPDSLTWLGRSSIGIVPTAVIGALIIYLIAWYLLKRTKFGLYTYAVGGNEDATRLSGISIQRTKIMIYSFTGILCGIAGIMIAGRMNGTSAIVGQGYELDAIAAVAIGGTDMSGGKGNIWGTLIGAVVMGVIRNGLNLLSVSPYWQMIIIGVVIVGAVSMDALRSRKQ